MMGMTEAEAHGIGDGTMIKQAINIIRSCQRALNRRLTLGEARDLLCDNTRWSRSAIVAVVDCFWDRNAPQARFWELINGSPVRIKIDCGQTLRHCCGGSTDEGYTYETNAWSFDGGELVSDRRVDARDCDGRIEHFQTLTCTFDRLRAGVIDSDHSGVVYPAWDARHRSQRDHSAEAMGY